MYCYSSVKSISRRELLFLFCSQCFTTACNPFHARAFFFFLSFQKTGSSKNLQSRMRGRHRNRKFQDQRIRTEAGISTACYGSPEAGHLAQAGKPFREIYFKLIVLFAGFYIDMFCFVLNVFWDCSLFIYY